MPFGPQILHTMPVHLNYVEQIMSWPPHITVAAIVEQDGKFLVVEEPIDGRLVINQPAGHLDPGETLFEAVQRETLEEAGWVVRPTAVTGIYHYYDAGVDITYHRITFAAEPLEHSDRELDPAIHAVHWVTLAELQTLPLRSPLVTQCIYDYRERGGVSLEFVTHVRTSV